MIRKGLLLTLTVLLATASTQVRADSDRVIEGGATTFVTGGSGTPPTPVITKLAFHWRDGEGKFECLALVPSEPAGQPGSGKFDTNAMYVTGKILTKKPEEIDTLSMRPCPSAIPGERSSELNCALDDYLVKSQVRHVKGKSGAWSTCFGYRSKREIVSGA